VVPSNTVLDGGVGPPQEGEMGVGTLLKICVAYCGQTVTDIGMVTIDSL